MSGNSSASGRSSAASRPWPGGALAIDAGTSEAANAVRMLRLSEALDGWLHPRDGRGPARFRRALFLGAGFTRCCWSGAPLFSDLARELERRLREHHLFPAHLEQPSRQGGEQFEPSEVVELFDHELGRVALGRGILAEPAGDRPRLYPPVDPTRRPLPPRAESAFRTLREWREVLDLYHPTHLAPLSPGGPAVLLGRLVAEGVVGEILSTNWDAYVELGCLLAGVRVCDGDEDAHDKPGWLEAIERQLWVYETASEAALRPRPRSATVLLKIHGGVRTLRGILDRLEAGRLSPPQAEAAIRRALRVSTEDVVHWDEPARWVAEAAGDGLRAHDVLAVGVSGSDPAIYQAFRKRIREWEQERRGSIRERQKSAPGLVAVDPRPTLRFSNMLTVDGHAGPHRRFARADGWSALRGAYSGWLLGRLTNALKGGDRSEVGSAELLHETWCDEVDRLAAAGVHGDDARRSPLVDLLCSSLGPATRLAAIAQDREPFCGGVGGGGFARRWWYAPWGPAVTEECLRDVGAFAAALTRGSSAGAETDIEVDPWTGVIWVPAGHLLGRTRSGLNLPANLLPIVWPWPVSNGLRSQRLREELRDRFGWGPGRSLDHLARAPLILVPLPSAAGTSPWCELTVAGVEARRFEPPNGKSGSFWRDAAEQVL